MPQILATQRTPEWLAARKGKITASLAPAILGVCPHRGPLSAWREIVEGHHQEDNKHMAWGREFESQALNAYEAETGRLISPGGFWTHPTLDWLAASPDGMVDNDGQVEAKVPSLIVETIPHHHAIQMGVQLACTERHWCDYWQWSHAGHRGPYRQFRGMDAEKIMLEQLQEWYETYVLTRTPPPRRKRRAVS